MIERWGAFVARRALAVLLAIEITDSIAIHINDVKQDTT